MKLFAGGGDAAHSPSHLASCLLSAWVARADALHFRVQLTSDGVPVLFGHDDLSAQTDAAGPVSSVPFSRLNNLDLGHAFAPGSDRPWRRVREPFERLPDTAPLRARVARLDAFLRQVDEAAAIAIDLDSVNADGASFDDLLTAVVTECARYQFASVTLVTHHASRIPTIKRAAAPRFGVGFSVAPGVSLSNAMRAVDLAGLALVFCDGDKVDAKADGVVGRFANVAAFKPDARLYGVETDQILEFGDFFSGPVTYFTDSFAGDRLNAGDWISGISAGFENPARFIYNAMTGGRLVDDDRVDFDTRLYVANGLVIDIKPGKQYASAGVVTRFPIGGDCVVEASYTYDNPERATMCLMGLINSDVFSEHRGAFGQDGSVERPRWSGEHQIFDTHGNPPFIGIEHEESDGTRIISNRVASGFYQWYNNFYPPNVGDGTGRVGRYRLQRRGRYFAGWYKDPANTSWVGVGAHENASMNERLYVRMGAKHYPKADAPSPLPANKVVFSDFSIARYLRR